MGLGQDVLARLPRALACEWLVTNGLGGSASGTAAGAITRGSHALLAALRDGIAHAALLKLDERVRNDEGTFDLACVVQPNGTAKPAGHRLLESFTVDPWPTWRYRAGATVLEKTLMMVWEHDAVVVSYRLVEGPSARVTASPVLVARPLTAGGAHPEAPDHAADAPTMQAIPGRVRVQLAPDAPLLTLWHNGAFLPGRAWTTLRHLDRDYDERAHLPGYIEGAIAPGAAVHVVASIESELFRALAREARLGLVPPHTLAECVAALESDERERLGSWGDAARRGALETAREAATARHAPPPEAGAATVGTAALARAFDVGLVRRAGRLTLLDRLPHATERGADVLRGVLALLALRSFDAARDVLRGQLEYVSEGRAPERFEPDGTPVYGDPEPALWLVIAGERYVRRRGDVEFARTMLYPALEELMRHCRAGAPGGLRVDGDGLLMTLEPPDPELVALYDEEQARAATRRRVRRRPLEPPAMRVVKRADLNALWYHANLAMSQLARVSGRRENAAFYLAWAHEHQQRFHERFWDESHGCLYLAIEDDAPVVGLAPSQLWAASLAPVLLRRDLAQTLLETMDGTLGTPFGLRPAPGAELAQVAWLGPLAAALLRAHDRDAAIVTRVRERFDAIVEWLGAEGLGVLPETFAVTEGDTPPASRGAASPAAAASLLRAWIEDLDHTPEDSVALQEPHAAHPA